MITTVMMMLMLVMMMMLMVMIVLIGLINDHIGYDDQNYDHLIGLLELWSGHP